MRKKLTPDELIKKYSYLPISVVTRYLKRKEGLHIEDVDRLYGDARLVLVKAAKNFDPSKGTSFQSYAWGRINGAVLDAMRGLDTISRQRRNKRKEILNFRAELADQLGRQPTEQEMAQYLEIDLKEYQKMLEEIQVIDMVSLESKVIDDVPLLETLSSGVDEEQRIMDRQQLEHIYAAVEKMSPLHKLIIEESILNKKSGREVAKMLQEAELTRRTLHESRISQLKREAMKELSRILLENQTRREHEAELKKAFYRRGR